MLQAGESEETWPRKAVGDRQTSRSVEYPSRTCKLGAGTWVGTRVIHSAPWDSGTSGGGIIFK